MTNKDSNKEMIGCQIKIFFGYNRSIEELENKINDWLSTNDVEIKSINVSSRKELTPNIIILYKAEIKNNYV